MKIKSIIVPLFGLLFCSCASWDLANQYKINGVDVELIRQSVFSKSCASTCLLMVAKYWGIKKSIDEIEKELGERPKSGYTLGQLNSWANKNNFKSFVFKGSIEDIILHTKKKRPLILVIKKNRKQNHAIIVKSVTEDGKIAIIDPASNRTLFLSRDKLQKNWAPLGCPILLIAPYQPKYNT